jgi:hypothetical protein
VKLQAMIELRLDKTRLCALIDATPFAVQQMVAALGIAKDGKKMILVFAGERQNMPLQSASCSTAGWTSPSRGFTYWMMARP